MKKFLIVTSLILALTACGQGEVNNDVIQNNVGNDAIEANVGDGVYKETDNTNESSDKIDVGDGVLDVPNNTETTNTNGDNNKTNIGDGAIDVPKKTEQTQIDIDLSGFSTLMAYSEAYNILSKPDDYLGKIIKVKGLLSTFRDPSTGKYYFATIIADQTSCCQIGMEFILAGDYQYPKDYPALGTEIEVTGEFQTYMEGTMRYCNLINAKMTY